MNFVRFLGKNTPEADPLPWHDNDWPMNGSWAADDALKARRLWVKLRRKMPFGKLRTDSHLNMDFYFPSYMGYIILPIDFHSIIFQDGHIAPPTRTVRPSQRY